MGKGKRKRRVRTAAEVAGARRARRKTALMAMAFLLVGMALLGSSLAYRWHVSAEADRLGGVGVPVTAYITDRAGGGGRGSGIDRIEIHYLYDAWIPCAGVTGCRSTPEREMPVLVDPADPQRFLAENGHTDGSLSFLMSWTTIPVGLVATVAGVGVLIFVIRE
ncbi:hypothetical protein [Micromonospora sp. NBC_01813]|uniref:hypothetical protein n=1 Tax=Micromonospora sp. NBC_01813 TaxID=2975988 RepID=UPI002DDAF87A|nr:hypothetical protein [Micromonospora sp. NBC_01813]WSA11173.1 hypothetical protein OG958_10580 [Micromonospora sp. NBC_01813]